jgi:hypothetical protein
MNHTTEKNIILIKIYNHRIKKYYLKTIFNAVKIYILNAIFLH